MCTTEGVHTLTCCTHIFLLHSLSAHIRTFSCACTYTHGSCSRKWCLLHVCLWSLSRLLPSHVSPVLAAPAHSPRHHVPVPILAELSRPESAGHAPLRTCIEKFWLPGQVGCTHRFWAHRVRQDHFCELIDDPDLDEISDFSKHTRENTELFGVTTMFKSSVSHVSHGDFALRQREREEEVLWSVLQSRCLWKVDRTIFGVILFSFSENSILMDEISENVLNDELNKL